MLDDRNETCGRKVGRAQPESTLGPRPAEGRDIRGGTAHVSDITSVGDSDHR
jgi:hypothetical protein